MSFASKNIGARIIGGFLVGSLGSSNVVEGYMMNNQQMTKQQLEALAEQQMQEQQKEAFKELFNAIYKKYYPTSLQFQNWVKKYETQTPHTAIIDDDVQYIFRSIFVETTLQNKQTELKISDKDLETLMRKYLQEVVSDSAQSAQQQFKLPQSAQQQLILPPGDKEPEEKDTEMKQDLGLSEIELPKKLTNTDKTPKSETKELLKRYYIGDGLRKKSLDCSVEGVCCVSQLIPVFLGLGGAAMGGSLFLIGGAEKLKGQHRTGEKTWSKIGDFFNVPCIAFLVVAFIVLLLLEFLVNFFYKSSSSCRPEADEEEWVWC